MDEAKQLREDEKLLRRIDEFGKGLTSKQKDMIEGFMRRVAEGKLPDGFLVRPLVPGDEKHQVSIPSPKRSG